LVLNWTVSKQTVTKSAREILVLNWTISKQTVTESAREILVGGIGIKLDCN
jgi:hypothetical protein